jgi:hypothetical protein
MSAPNVEKPTRRDLLATIATSFVGGLIVAMMLEVRSIVQLIVYPIIAAVVTALMLIVIVARDGVVRSIAWSDDERFRDVDELAARRGATAGEE